MTIKAILPNSAKFSNKREAIKLPDEIDTPISVSISEEGEYVFMIPFEIDMRKAIVSDLKFKIDVIDGKNKPEYPGVVDLAPRVIQPGSLERFQMLPGQVNADSKYMQRLKNRNMDSENSKTSTVSGFIDADGKKHNARSASFMNKKENTRVNRSDNFTSDKIKKGINSRGERIRAKRLLKDSIANSKLLRRDKIKSNASLVKATYVLDYTSRINNSIVSDLRKGKIISDIAAFGFKRVYRLGSPENPGRNPSKQSSSYSSSSKTNNFTSSRPVVTSKPIMSSKFLGVGSDTKIKNSAGGSKTEISPKFVKTRKSIPQQIQKLYKEGKDPSTMFGGDSTHRTAKHHRRGTKPAKIKSPFKGLEKEKPLRQKLRTNTRSKRDKLLASVFPVRNISISEGTDGPGSFSFDITPQPSNFPFVYTTDEVNRSRVVYLRYVLEDDHKSGGTVHFAVRITNNKGLNLSRKKYVLNYTGILNEQLSVPDDHPSLNIRRKEGRDSITALITNPLNQAIDYKLYRKVMRPDANIDSSDVSFKLIESNTVGPNSTKKSLISQSFVLKTLYRMTYSYGSKVNNEIYYSNYVNDSLGIKDDNRTSNDVTIFALPLQQDIQGRESVSVELYGIPLEATSMKVERRDLTLRNKRYKLITNTGERSREFVSIDSASKSAKFVDENVKDGRKYEYRVVLKTDKDQLIKVNKTAICDYTARERYFSPRVSGLTKTGRSSYQFMLHLDKKKSDLDDLLEDLSGDEFELFKDKIKELTQGIKTISKAKVQLYNLTMNTVVDLSGPGKTSGRKAGVVNNPSDGDVISFEASPNCQYKIVVTPFELTPQIILEKVQSSLDDVEAIVATKEESKLSAMRRSKIANAKRKATKIKSKSTKFFTKRAIKRGTITSSKVEMQKTLGDIKQSEVTGDVVVYNFDTIVNYKFDARAKNILILPDHRSRITFEVGGDIKDIDFFIISGNKEGETFPIGPAHCDKKSKVLNYVDHTNIDYLGRVDYYVNAVFEDGTVSEKRFIGAGIFVNKVVEF